MSTLCCKFFGEEGRHGRPFEYCKRIVNDKKMKNVNYDLCCMWLEGCTSRTDIKCKKTMCKK